METALNYIAKIGMVTISTPNTHLDGTGTMGQVFESGGTYGSIVKTIIIKAQTDTKLGMVRLFVSDGDIVSLLMEINVPEVTKSGRDLSFYSVIPLNYKLESGCKIYASTQINDTFNIIAEALEYDYFTDMDTNIVKYSSQTGVGILDTANEHLNGTGDLVELLSALGDSGCEISSIKIKF